MKSNRQEQISKLHLEEHLRKLDVSFLHSTPERSFVTKDLEKSKEVLEKRILAEKGNWEDYLILGSLYRVMGEPGRALKLHHTLLARSDLKRSQKALVLFELGQSALTLKNFELAKAFLEESLDLSKTENTQLALSYAFERLQEWDHLQAILEKLSKTNETQKTRYAYLLADLADQAMRSGRLTQAEKYLSKCHKIDTPCPPADLGQAKLFIKQGKYEKAIEDLKTFILGNPGLSFLAFRLLEDAHFQMNDFESFAMTLRELIQQSSDNVFLHFSMARHLVKRKRFDESKEFLNQALELNPFYINAVRERARVESIDPNQSWPFLELFFEVFKRSRRSICPSCQKRFREIVWHCNHCLYRGPFSLRYELPAP